MIVTMLWIALFSSLIPTISCVQCMSSSGKPVDWFMVYKLPKIGSDIPILKKGYGHLYLDVNSPAWQLSKYSMNATTHAVAYTLQPIYRNKKSDDFMYAMYNDEDPNKREPRKFGHSKGVLAFDKQSGFWMVHSTPRFPPFQNASYMWPHTATTYGQSFLCVSYSYSMLNEIANQILYNFVQVFDQWAPQSFLSDNPNLKKVLSEFRLKSSPWKRQAPLSSLQGTKFISFAKASEFGEDLYARFVAPSLKSDLLTETWQHGGHNLTSDCSGQYKVYNVLDIAFNSSQTTNIAFPDTKDHSKWAVSKGNGQWVCIGDINRQRHQEERGGGTVCIQSVQVWKQFSQSVQRYEQCPKT